MTHSNLTFFFSILKTEWIAVGKHSTSQIGGYGKLNEEQLRIFDDVPGSAVELQAKDKVIFSLFQCNEKCRLKCRFSIHKMLFEIKS